jgi:hypothetical protein
MAQAVDPAPPTPAVTVLVSTPPTSRLTPLADEFTIDHDRITAAPTNRHPRSSTTSPSTSAARNASRSVALVASSNLATGCGNAADTAPPFCRANDGSPTTAFVQNQRSGVFALRESGSAGPPTDYAGRTEKRSRSQSSSTIETAGSPGATTSATARNPPLVDPV